MRDYRFRFLGALFAIASLVTIAASEQFRASIRALFESSEPLSQFLMAAVGLGIVLVTSEAVGFVIFNVALAWHYRPFWGRARNFSFYSRELRKAPRVKAWFESPEGEGPCPEFAKCWRDLDLDVKFSWFWQQAPTTFIEWVSRRHSAYLAHYGARVSIVLGILSGAAVVTLQGFCFGAWHLAVLAMSAVVWLALWYNGSVARREAREFLRLWTGLEETPTSDPGREEARAMLDRLLKK